MSKPTQVETWARRVRSRWLLLLYCGASLLHFAHNAENVVDYPNLPEWITRSSVYGSWLAILLVGVGGYYLLRRGWTFSGLALLAIYTALGLDGLLHYGQAPMPAHSLGMNLTIWIEVLAAAVALTAVLLLLASHLRSRDA